MSAPPRPPGHRDPTGVAHRRGPLRVGDRVQLTDPKGRLHTITLTAGESFFTHRGSFEHTELIGQPEGTVVVASGGTEFVAFRPLMADNVLSMPRGAAVVYPKDTGQILMMADVFPGARVVEAGVGSGALSMALLRAVGDAGLVHSFELREEFADIARGNVEQYFGGPHPAWRVTVADVVDGLAGAGYDGTVDRVVLDMLSPWACVEAVATALRPGGVLTCYVATVTQLSRLAEVVRADHRFTEPQACETMVRGWHVDGLAVRPDHRMVGHTGFLLSTRRMAEGMVAPVRRKRGAKVTRPEDADPDAIVDLAYGTQQGHVELDNDSDFGGRQASDRKLRRLAKRSREQSEQFNRLGE